MRRTKPATAHDASSEARCSKRSVTGLFRRLAASPFNRDANALAENASELLREFQEFLAKHDSQDTWFEFGEARHEAAQNTLADVRGFAWTLEIFEAILSGEIYGCEDADANHDSTSNSR